jgi:hypothetical protein
MNAHADQVEYVQWQHAALGAPPMLEKISTGSNWHVCALAHVRATRSTTQKIGNRRVDESCTLLLSPDHAAETHPGEVLDTAKQIHPRI